MREYLIKEILNKQRQLKKRQKENDLALELQQNLVEFQKSLWDRLCEEYYDDNSYSIVKYQRPSRILSVSYKVYKDITILNEYGDTCAMFFQKYRDVNINDLCLIEPPINNQPRTICHSSFFNKDSLFGEYKDFFSVSWSYSSQDILDKQPNEIRFMVDREEFGKILDDIKLKSIKRVLNKKSCVMN